MKKIAKGLVYVVFGIVGLSVCAGASDVIGNLSGEVHIAQGELSYQLPLTTPSSVNSLNPGLSISYRQRGGASTLGAGFALNATAAINRCTPNIQKDGFSAGLELNRNARFCHAGNKLIAIGGDSGGANTEYRAYRDDNNRYISFGNSHNHTPCTGNNMRPMVIFTPMSAAARRLTCLPAGY